MVVGAGMVGNDVDYLIGTLDRIRESSAAVPRDHENAKDYLRAVVDHAERREREAQAEAEQGGVVILEARELRADVRLFKENRLIRFKPQLVIEDHRGESPLQDIGSHQIIHAPQPIETELIRGRGRRKKPQIYTKPDGDGFDELAWELDQYVAHADLNDLEKIALIFMRTNARTPDYEIAELLGISQGYYSKLQVKITEKMRAGRKKWRKQNGMSEFDEPFISYTPNYPPARKFQYGGDDD